MPSRFLSLFVAVLPVIACFAITTSSAGSGKDTKILTDLRWLKESAVIYRQQVGTYPADDEESTWFEKLVRERLIWDDWLMTTPDGRYPVDDYSQSQFVYEVPQGPDAPLVDGAYPIVRWIGFDGIDNDGTGDDIDTRFGITDGYYHKSGYPVARRCTLIFAMLTFIGVIAFRHRLGSWPLRMMALMLWLSIAGMIVGVIGDAVECHGCDGVYEWLSQYSLLGVAVVLLALFFRWAFVSVVEFRKRSALRRRRCLSCSYDLRGAQSAICPECGTDQLEIAKDLD